MLLWVNFHIGFVFGFLILGAFFLKALFLRDRQRCILLLWITAASIIAGCVNPSGWNGFIYPLAIYRNYGYTTGENRSLFTFLRLDYNPEWQLNFFGHLLLLAAAIVIVWWIVMKDVRTRLAELLLLGSAAALAASAIRNIPVFSFLMIPLLATLLQDVIEKKNLSILLWPRVATVGIMILGLGACWVRHEDREKAGVFGLGLKDGTMATADFMHANGVTGPIFNDFNNGSYLIFNLFHPGRSPRSTDECVIIDQRPEAFPPEAFALHTSMEADDGVWRREDAKYHFNAIVYSMQLNNAPETERFLLARVRDPEWAPVYTDDFSLIYLRRTDRNAAAIKAHELPRSMFR